MVLSDDEILLSSPEAQEVFARVLSIWQRTTEADIKYLNPRNRHLSPLQLLEVCAGRFLLTLSPAAPLTHKHMESARHVVAARDSKGRADAGQRGRATWRCVGRVLR